MSIQVNPDATVETDPASGAVTISHAGWQNVFSAAHWGAFFKEVEDDFKEEVLGDGESVDAPAKEDTSEETDTPVTDGFPQPVTPEEAPVTPPVTA